MDARGKGDLLLPCKANHEAAAVARARMALIAMMFAVAGCAVAEGPAFTTVAGALRQCGVPGTCGQKLACEGKIISVTARVDATNIFERSHYPNLPQEKFTLTDATGSEALEVWATPPNRDVNLSALAAQAGRRIEVSVRAIAVGVDLPIATRCTRTIHLELNSSSDLTVGREK